MPATAALLAMTIGWKLFAPLPDPIGFGGMFAGEVGGKLVAGGGSQFREKPNWLQGAKSFSDRIFVLADPDGKWSEAKTRLPRPSGGFAAAADHGTVYVAGGMDMSGCLTQSMAIRAGADGDLAITPLPDLPEPIGYGAGAVVAGRFYVAGGQSSPTAKTASTHVWSLAVEEGRASGTWRQEPDLPGDGVFVPAAAAVGGKLWVMGGVGFDAEGKAVPHSAVGAFNPATRTWVRRPGLPQARVGPASPAPVVDGAVLVIGGYANIFPGQARDHPGFDAQTYRFDLASGGWENGPVLPHEAPANRDQPGDAGPAPMIGAPCVLWRGYLVCVSGEVRASVRSPQVIGWPLSKGFRP